MYRNKKVEGIFYLIRILNIAFYLFSCLTPFFNPNHFYLLSFFPLSFPFLIIGMCFFFIISIIYQKIKWTLLIFICILLGYNSITKFFGFSITKQIQNKTNYNGKPTIKVLSWNVNFFLNSRISADTPNNPRKKMIDFVQETNADIICFQDAINYELLEGFKSNIQDFKVLGYPYYYFSNDLKDSKHIDYQYGTMIFSKYPIIDSGNFPYQGHFYESLAFADIKINSDTIRVYNTHLRSMGLNNHNSRDLSEEQFILLQDDTTALLHENVFGKIRFFDQKHAHQAEQAKQVLNKTKKPFIFCADLNSVPSSYVYSLLHKGLNDAFLTNSFGFGNTYDLLIPLLRIDVIFYTRSLKSISYECPRIKLSDHFPIISEIAFQ